VTTLWMPEWDMASCVGKNSPMLALEDKWIWDSWAVDDGDFFHLFFLQAPKSLGDAGRRHINASIGHARSRDLVAWELLPDALGPRPGSWDDLATWTGSVVRADDGRWRMFYTAINTGPHGLKDQRIGVVESADLVTWIRTTDRQVLDVDPRWYQTVDNDPTASETWRDPLVFRDLAGDGWHMILSARGLEGEPNNDALLAHAWSPDLTQWEVRPPLTTGGAGFGEIEVPLVHKIDGQYVLVFTCHPKEQSAQQTAKYGSYCTWSVLGDSPLGPWDITKARPFVAEPDLFAAPLIQRRDGSWVILGFRKVVPEEDIIFEISDPIPVGIVDGTLARVD
jgi:beta-fructofuranosidase